MRKEIQNLDELNKQIEDKELALEYCLDRMTANAEIDEKGQVYVCVEQGEGLNYFYCELLRDIYTDQFVAYVQTFSGGGTFYRIGEEIESFFIPFHTHSTTRRVYYADFLDNMVEVLESIAISATV